MENDEYINKRISDQIHWYDEKAKHCRKWHERLQIISIGLSAVVPLVAVIGASFKQCEVWATLATAAFGSTTTITLAIDKLKRNQELHAQYRSTCERLKQELWLFSCSAGEYGPDDRSPKQLFVDRCESIMATENGRWAELNEKKKT